MFWSLAGVIAVVFCAIGISLVAEKRVHFSNESHELRTTIEHQSARLDSLRREHERLSKRWESHSRERGRQTVDLEAAARLSGESESRVSQLVGRRTELAANTERLSGEFTRYRESYRRQLRQSHVDRHFDEVRFGNADSYHDVTILAVNDEGIRIRHSRGLATIRYQDLSHEWRERMHWHPDEGRAAVPAVERNGAARRSEPGASSGHSPGQGSSSGSRRNEPRPAASNEGAILSARADYRRERARLNEARKNAAEARRLSHGNDRSVPGSLETWAERAERYEAMSERLEIRAAAARNELRRLDPGDPLLRERGP